MAVWVLAKSVESARNSLNEIAPSRDKASDGSIGDQAHQSGTSGHNPDESGNAERQDSDNKNEVRAVDLDKDLRINVTMSQIVLSIIANPRDRQRLLYIIWNRVIWTKSSGWKSLKYTGSNPHDQHMHISGDPAYDEDGAPWQSILKFGDDMPSAQEVAQAVFGMGMGAKGSQGSFHNWLIKWREDEVKRDELMSKAIAALSDQNDNVDTAVVLAAIEAAKKDINNVDEAVVERLADMDATDLVGILKDGMSESQFVYFKSAVAAA